jgi:hypothetical protein
MTAGLALACGAWTSDSSWEVATVLGSRATSTADTSIALAISGITADLGRLGISVGCDGSQADDPVVAA